MLRGEPQRLASSKPTPRVCSSPLACGGGGKVGDRLRDVGEISCSEDAVRCRIGSARGIKALRCHLIIGLFGWAGHTDVAAVMGWAVGDLAGLCGHVRRVIVWVLGGFMRVSGSAADGPDNQ